MPGAEERYRGERPHERQDGNDDKKERPARSIRSLSAQYPVGRHNERIGTGGQCPWVAVDPPADRVRDIHQESYEPDREVRRTADRDVRPGYEQCKRRKRRHRMPREYPSPPRGRVLRPHPLPYKRGYNEREQHERERQVREHPNDTEKPIQVHPPPRHGLVGIVAERKESKGRTEKQECVPARLCGVEHERK